MSLVIPNASESVGEGHNKNNIDFLRFLGATFVLFSHSFALSGENEPLVGSLTFGGIGVSIFFIMGGYLITKSWERLEDAPQFLWNRFLRLTPGIMGLAIITTFIIGPLVTQIDLTKYFTHPTTYSYFFNLFFVLEMRRAYHLPGVFLTNPLPEAVNGSLWTLPYEIELYFIMAFIGLLKFYKKRISAVFFFGLSLYVNLTTGDALTYNRSQFALYFFAGSIFYLYREKIHYSKKGVILALILLTAFGFTPYFQISAYFLFPYLIFSAAFAPNKYLNNFSNKGDFSYGLYIYAFPVQQIVVFFSENQVTGWILFPIAWGITFSIAFLSWRFIESKALKYKKLNLRGFINEDPLRAKLQSISVSFKIPAQTESQSIQ